MTDRGTILSTMYQDDTDDGATETRPLTSFSGRTRRIRVGAIEYEVPTIEYTQQLEQTLARLARTIDQQQRMIERVVTTLSKAHHSQLSQAREMEDLRRDMSRKINQRDLS